MLRALGQRFSCAPADVPAAIDKLSKDGEATKAEITALRGRLADAIIATLPGTGPVVAAIPADAEVLRSIGGKLVTAGRDALLCAPDEGGTPVVLFRAQGSSIDCGALWKQLSGKLGGRGGGRADRAEGKLTGPVTDWPALVASCLPA